MTFHQGDYARIDAIPNKRETAAGLYRRALDYHPDARAFLGLGMLGQQRGDFAAASDILGRGLNHYPEDGALQMCMAVNDMNQGCYGPALKRLQQMEPTAQTREWIAKCRKVMKA
jgi:Tfp pilus assembly protein PilF